MATQPSPPTWPLSAAAAAAAGASGCHYDSSWPLHGSLGGFGALLGPALGF